MEQSLFKPPIVETPIQPKPAEGLRGRVREWTEKGRQWFAQLKGKVDEKPREVIGEVVKAPEYEEELSAGPIIEAERVEVTQEPEKTQDSNEEERPRTDSKSVELTLEQKQQAQGLDYLVKNISDKDLIDSGKKGSMYHILNIDGEPSVVAKLLVSSHNARGNFETQARINREDDETCLAYFREGIWYL